MAAPVYVAPSARTSVDGFEIYLTYDQQLDSGNKPEIHQFDVHVNGNLIDYYVQSTDYVSSSDVNGTDVVLILDSSNPIGEFDDVILDYNDTTGFKR